MESKDPPQEEVLLVVRKSRKAFLLEYFCAILLLCLLIILYVKRSTMNHFIIYLVLLIATIAICSAEISRLFLRYVITPSKIVIIKGVIKQNKKNINFHPLSFIPDINLRQGRLQRILNYGTVYLQSGGSESIVEFKDVDHPQEFLEFIEDLIEKTRSVKQKKE